jgi:hypothetical protein
MAKRSDGTYSDTPLAKKLGVVGKDNAPREVALLGAPPEDFVAWLGELPANVSFRKNLTAKTVLALYFVCTARQLDACVQKLAAKLPQGASAWIIRPKTHLKPDFGENDVRNGGLAVGLVDYKICSVNDEWSGLKFAWRKTARK